MWKMKYFEVSEIFDLEFRGKVKYTMVGGFRLLIFFWVFFVLGVGCSFRFKGII